MARRKSARQIAASRRNIRIAQKASARARKGAGGLRQRARVGAAMVRYDPKTRRRVMIAGGIAAVGVAGYQANYHAKYVTGYHRSSAENIKQIAKTNKFKSETHNRKVEGSESMIWFDKKKHGPGANFGPEMVKVKRIPRKAVTSHKASMQAHMKAHMPAGMPVVHNKTWIGVDTSTLSSLKAKRVRRPLRATFKKTTYKLDMQKAKALDARTSLPGARHMAYLVDNWDPSINNKKYLKKRR